MFLAKHIPSLTENQKKYNQQFKKIKQAEQNNDSKIDKFKKELDELTTVWAHMEDKTFHMNKLLSSLFEEVADMENHQTQI